MHFLKVIRLEVRVDRWVELLCQVNRGREQLRPSDRWQHGAGRPGRWEQTAEDLQQALETAHPELLPSLAGRQTARRGRPCKWGYEKKAGIST
jgi:hypothetical protein